MLFPLISVLGKSLPWQTVQNTGQTMREHAWQPAGCFPNAMTFAVCVPVWKVWVISALWENPDTTPAFLSIVGILGIVQLNLRWHLYLKTEQEMTPSGNITPQELNLILVSMWKQLHNVYFGSGGVSDVSKQPWWCHSYVIRVISAWAQYFLQYIFWPRIFVAVSCQIKACQKKY